jgi:hypothetical protein
MRGAAQTAQVKIGSLDLTIGGLQATVTPASPVIPKNIASGVQVVVTQNGQQLTPAAVAQYLGGNFQLAGEYSGPGLTQTVDVPQSTPATNSLILDLPAVNTSGNYTLSNLRFLVNGVEAFDVTPSTVTVQVIDQVLVTSVQTAPLTLSQILSMGVVLNSSAYTGFNFTVGLQLSSQVVNISFPVVFDANGVAVPQPLSPPASSLPGVPIPYPTIVPVLLTGGDGGGAGSLPPLPGGGGTVSIPSVIVIPGNVGYLKQFFSAQLYVTDGAPSGSGLTVDNITGTIMLPPGADGVVGTADDPLALPLLTSGAQSPTMNILAPGPGGTPSVGTLNPGDTGQGEWTIRGDMEGYYTINFGIAATLEGLPTGPFQLAGTATGGVLVRNPYFDMTFTVPGVVRKGELFNVFATVTNISQAAANNLTVNFNQGSTSGVTLVSPPQPVISTLNAGDSTTLTFQFTSLQTGQVVASYLNFDTSNGTTGSLNFSLGVYANGTPESPDTLVLPSSVDNLPTDVVDAAMRVLGQAWSVATAPSGTLPASVIPTSTTVVTQKALALAEAGLRNSLGEALPNALRDLGTDFFGGTTIDPGFDQVLRTTPAGQNFVSVLGAYLAQPATQAGGALAYELQLAQLEASGPNFVTFAVGSGTGAAPVAVTLTDGAGNTMTSGTPGGSVVSGALFPLGNTSSEPYLGLITSPTNSPYTLLLTPQASGTTDISISIPSGNGTVIRGAVAGQAVVEGQPMQVVADFRNPSNLVLQIDTAGNGTFATSVPLTTQVILPSGPTLISATVIGPDTVSQASPFGQNVVALFDRIVDGTTSGTASNYAVPSNSIQSVSKQLSGRLVFANLTQPEGPYVPTTFAVSGVADQRSMIGPAATVTMQSLLADAGAVVSGQVLAPDGTPSASATVTYLNAPYSPNCQAVGGELGIAAVPVESNGTYQFRYVHQDQCGSPFQMATNDPTTGALRQVTAYVRAAGQQMVINLALLGTGSVSGMVTGLNGLPVYNAQVVAVSNSDPQSGGSTFTDANGNYTISGITVGPVTVRAIQGISAGSNPGNIERAGTTAIVNVILNGGVVNVTGTVTQSQGGVVSPVPGEPVVYYIMPTPVTSEAVGVAITAADGSFSILGMPAGAYNITAAINTQLSTNQMGVAAAGENLVVPLQIVVPVTGTVNGTVSLPNGTGAAGVVVYQNQNGVLSNPNGTYTLTGVPVLPSQSQTIYARTVDGTRSGQVNVVVGSATTPVNGANITLSGLGSAQFTVLDSTGKPLAGIPVTLLNGSLGCGGPMQTTNAGGVVVFTGLGIGTATAIAVQTQGNFSDLAKASAMVTQDGTTGFATMQFNGAGTVTGSVIGPPPNNLPVLGAVVQLTSNYPDTTTSCAMLQTVTQSVQTGANGNFTFTGVNVGKIGVTASQSFYPTQAGAQGTLAPAGATLNFPPLQLVSTTSGILSGTIFLPDGVTPAGAGVQVTANGQLPNITVNTDANGNYAFAAIFPQGQYTLSASDPVSGGVNQMQVFLRAGQNMTQNMRLLGTGTVNVTVVDGAGVPVNSAFVTLTETTYPFASFSGSLDASNLGVLPFPNVFESNFSVQATDPFGRGGRTSGTLPQGIASVRAQVQLTTTGTVQGHFYMPDGVTPIPNASIVLTANGIAIGQFTSLGTGDIGSYSFEYVPAGPIELAAQDPLTGRTGIAAGTINTQGQVLTLNVTAQGLNTIEGLVTSNGSPQAGASVNIVSGTFSAMTTADENGMYLMTGVPEGVIVATASLGNGFLSGTASATVSGDGQSITLNVALRASGTVTGQVVQADGVTPASTSTVSINIGGFGGGTATTTTDAQGNFTLQNVPAGSGTITAQVLGSIDQASAPVVVAAGTNTVKVTLNGTGGISGVALDSNGAPTAGTVFLKGTGQFPYYLTLTAAADGTFSVPQVLDGPFTAQLSVTTDGLTLYGTYTGSVTFNQTTQFTVKLQSSGTVTGTVLRPDGQTPAVGANVTIQLSTGGLITLQVQNDGTFTATGVPLSSFTVQIIDPTTMGLAAIEGPSITTNGQILNLGTITLDGNALSVVSSNPADGATGVGVTQPLMISFSEALAGAGGISVMNGSSNLSMSSSLSADGKTVTLQGTLPDGVPLTLNISTQVTDVFGRNLLMAQVIHFTTVDLTPPFVVSISPANGAVQVPVSSTVAVTFNKALSTSASLGNVISVNPGTGAIPGTTALTAPDVLTFTPAAALLNNSIYSVTVNGATSFGGNVQTSAFNSSFVSPETNMPVLQISSPANGSYVNSATPTISISIGDPLSGINAATATLQLDGTAVTPQVSSASISFTPSTPLANGPHTLVATVQNNAGIVGTLSSSFIVDTSMPSSASLSGITTGQTLKGLIAISATAMDSLSGIASINFLVDGSLQAVLSAPSFSASYNSALLPDGPHSFAVQAVDGAGTSGPVSTAILAYVENQTLAVSISSPLPNATLKTQVAVTAVPSAPVAKAIFSLGSQAVTVTASPYQTTLSLAGVADGPQIITVAVTDFVGNTASSTVTINVLQTPPSAPNGNLIFAEPPANGSSLVHGLSGAIGSTGQTVNITDTVSHATATATVAADGSFATSIVAAIGDTLSLTATDIVGNVSTVTLITVRSTPSLPASSGNTSLMYQGDLVDRVGLTPGSFTPDGQNDAVFTLSVSIGDSVTRTLSSVTLVGNGLARSTLAGGTPLGVAADVGSPLLNSPSGPVSFPITTGATLTLFAGDNGFIQPGDTYTATAAFSDGSTFVGTYTIVAPANAQYVAHSSTVTANPATVVVTGSTPSTSTITITNIRDINGNVVPDGAKIALSAASMASVNPAGTPIPSAGGTFTDGTPAANNANFSVYMISNGAVTATYATQPVTPTPISGAIAVVQMQAADANNNVLGTRVVSSQDINIRASTDSAIVSVSPGSLYADRGDHRSQVTIVLTDGNGNLLPDGTQAAITVAQSGSIVGSTYAGSAGGGLLSGAISPNGPTYVLGTMSGGQIVLTYTDSGVSEGTNQTQAAVVQVLPVGSGGYYSSYNAIGTASITLVGAAGADIDPAQPSVPQVSPAEPLQVRVQDVHDARGNLVPDGANIGITAAQSGTVYGSFYVSSAGGTIADGTPVPQNTAIHYYPLSSNGFVATYLTDGSSIATPGQTAIAVLQLIMVDPAGNSIDINAITVQNLMLVPPSNAVGSSQPASILGDGAPHISTVTFSPVIDAYGNVIPDGTVLAVSVNQSAATSGGFYISSAGGQILSGSPAASSGYYLHTVQGGALTITYADQNVTANPGQQLTANVVVVESNASGAIENYNAVGVVPVTIAGLTSAQTIASPTSLFANGGDFRSTVTLSNFRDASGNPVPDGTQVAVTAQPSGSVSGGFYVQSAGGLIVGGTPAPFSSAYSLFTVSNGQIVLQYSAQGVSVSSGSQTATVQVISVNPSGSVISYNAVATVGIQLVAGGSATFLAAPVDLTASGNNNQSSITFSGLTGSDGVTPIPDGALLGLTVANSAAIYGSFYVSSAGGAISSAGTSPGDGMTVPNNANFSQFTVAGGKIVAVYSDSGVLAGVGQTLQASVAVVPLNGTGNYFTTSAFSVGTINLHGVTSATANGPAALSLSTNTTGSVTFSGIKDSAGNTVPDGTVVAVTAASQGSVNNGFYVSSVGGTIVNGGSSPSGASYKVFTTVNGAVTVTYSTAGASVGTASVQILPATPNGTLNGNTSLNGGVWAINVTN